jgi:hypothetical protein
MCKSPVTSFGALRPKLSTYTLQLKQEGWGFCKQTNDDDSGTHQSDEKKVTGTGLAEAAQDCDRSSCNHWNCVVNLGQAKL